MIQANRCCDKILLPISKSMSPRHVRMTVNHNTPSTKYGLHLSVIIIYFINWNLCRVIGFHDEARTFEVIDFHVHRRPIYCFISFDKFMANGTVCKLCIDFDCLLLLNYQQEIYHITNRFEKCKSLCTSSVFLLEKKIN